jgi:hypothetical protein
MFDVHLYKTAAYGIYGAELPHDTCLEANRFFRVFSPDAIVKTLFFDIIRYNKILAVSFMALPSFGLEQLQSVRGGGLL